MEVSLRKWYFRICKWKHCCRKWHFLPAKMSADLGCGRAGLRLNPDLTLGDHCTSWKLRTVHQYRTYRSPRVG
eukprot:497179-Rhodomonas_salina.2